LSGPAAGAAGAFAVARDAGFARAITFDMGGTSTDIALCDGALPAAPELAIGGFTSRTPTVDVHTVGAGGGSIARLDAGGALRVGPHSAGAAPGPACYGRGRDCTVTDAQLVLRRLPARALLGGTIHLDERRARMALAPFLSHFGGDPHRAAQAVLDVVTANMERALRVVSVHRGYDPREFTLVASGGAGPLHACALADALELPRVLVPRYPGVLAALGAAGGDATASHARSVLRPLDAALLPALAAALEVVREAAARALAGTARPTAVEYALDLRYVGQSYELTVALDGGGATLDLDHARRDFDALHEARFGHHDPGAAVEVVTARATARAAGPAPELLAALRASPAAAGTREEPQPGRADVWIDGRRVPAALHARDALRAGDRIVGPAVVTQLDTTTYIAPGWVARVDDASNLVLERT
ncbi:MAG: hydantoinase/oxoprolinase family protein, partial [Chloroflexi bacterium]|nr:hydantoinase/oxoprolinase family protein [Chloroflexota bacterium]